MEGPAKSYRSPLSFISCGDDTVSISPCEKPTNFESFCGVETEPNTEFTHTTKLSPIGISKEETLKNKQNKPCKFLSRGKITSDIPKHSSKTICNVSNRTIKSDTECSNRSEEMEGPAKSYRSQLIIGSMMSEVILPRLKNLHGLFCLFFNVSSLEIPIGDSLVV
jgi:hypothetical protein